ncbi:hypothetical protein AB0E88_29310 [Streptomyces sp. NPDC028635]|uniref:hypothetical protein n=1 Tax=Streptomyces sp. NPDC028635 TaxID=3154800 RepID=UPI0033E7A03B
MEAGGQEQPAYTPSRQDVLAVLEALPLPSLPFVIADKMAAQRSGELSQSDSPPASTTTVLQVLRELEKDHLVKGYTLHQWEDLGIKVRDAERVVLDMLGDVQRAHRTLEEPARWTALQLDPQEPAHLTKFWWSVNNWRDAQAAWIRRRREADRQKAALQAAEQARRHSPVRDAVDSVLKERERLYKSRTPFDGPQGG